MSWLTSKIAPYIAGVIMFLALLAEVFRRGRNSQENESLIEDFQKDKDGRNAVVEEQAETDGLSSRELVDRMRGRDGNFSGL